jgi:PAS domain S-box-containing protein
VKIDDEEEQLRSVALQNAREILAARQRAEQLLLQTKEQLERTTQELARSLALTRAALESAPDGIVVTNTKGVITDFNRKYLELWALDALESRDHYQVLRQISKHFDDPEAFMRRIDEIYRLPDLEVADLLTLVDGRIFERVSKVQSIDGVDVGRVWSFRDITQRLTTQRELNELLEQKVAERTAELQRSEQRFEQLINGIKDCAIYMLDPTGHIVSWNPGAERIKGYTAAEIIGRNFSTFYTKEDRANGVPARALQTAVQEGKFEAEVWRVRKDGTAFWANVLIDPIHAEDGTLVGFAKITRDMTERRAMQEQLNQSQKMEAIGHLTGGVAHDFNNLLTVILGNLETIGRHILPDQARLLRALDQANRGAQRAATLTQQLLAFSRRQPLNPKPTDLNRLVRELSELVRRTLHEDIALETVLGGGLWRVDVDANQLESAVLNLVVNARDAMKGGGKLTIETANSHLDRHYAVKYSEIAPGQYVMICVTDTGCGMSKEVLSHAFDPFFTTKGIGEGTGLGLSQVFGFVKQSGGHIKLYSEVGEGTTVKIYLPRVHGEVGSEDIESSVPDAKGHPSEIILVVEDDDDVRIYSTEALRDLGFTVLEAHDGASALRVLEMHPEVMLLFTDVGLPTINGRQLADEARRRWPQLRVLFTSGYARNAIVHQGRLDPGVELLTKPFTRAELVARIRDVLDAKRI